VHSLSLRAPSSGVPCTRSSNCCMHVHTSEKKRASCRMDVFCLGREKERYTPGKNIVEQEGTSVCLCVVVTRTNSQCVPECGEREHRTGQRAPLCFFQGGKMCESAGRGGRLLVDYKIDATPKTWLHPHGPCVLRRVRAVQHL